MRPLWPYWPRPPSSGAQLVAVEISTAERTNDLTQLRVAPAARFSPSLVGLPELTDRLQLRRNRSHFSRLHIDSPGPEDTAEHIHMPLKSAGCDRDLFTSDAVAMIHQAATGGMRETDLATASLCVAARRN